MTPAVRFAEQQNIAFSLHSYKHDPKLSSYGLEAAEKLEVDPERVFKTLIVQLDTSECAVAVVPVTRSLNLKSFAAVCGAKKAQLADKSLVRRLTGYVLGGVSPLGQKKRLRTVVADTARTFPAIYVSGGRRGLEIELAPDDLVRHTGGFFASIC